MGKIADRYFEVDPWRIVERGFDPGQALMVGDTVHDWEVARALGVRCVLCSAGHQPAHTLRATGAAVISSLSQLNECL